MQSDAGMLKAREKLTAVIGRQDISRCRGNERHATHAANHVGFGFSKMHREYAEYLVSAVDRDFCWMMPTYCSKAQWIGSA